MYWGCHPEYRVQGTAEIHSWPLRGPYNQERLSQSKCERRSLLVLKITILIILEMYRLGYINIYRIRFYSSL